MSTHPYIPLYVDDYDAHTGHLTAEEDGVYSRLLRLAWRTPGCSLPDDHGWIARKIRLQPDDYERIGRPVLVEFFKLVRGRFVQKRLKREYDVISRKKSARREAGKKGGDAKALKGKEKTPSNASVLPADMRAFPEPEPYPEDRPPIPPRGEAEFKLALQAYPAAGLENVGEDALWRAWLVALESVSPAGLLATVQAYAASEYIRNRGRPKRFDRWLLAGAYAQHVPATAAATWAGPPDIRAKVAAAMGEGWTRSWWDHTRWCDLPERAVIALSDLAFDRLTAATRDALGPVLAELGIQIRREIAA